MMDSIATKNAIIQLPVMTWLQVFAAIMPPTGVLVVGAGNGLCCINP